MGAVMSHLGARILSVLREDRSYELRDNDGNRITWADARRLILTNYQVPEEIERERRRRKTIGRVSPKTSRKRRETAADSTYEAAKAPQSAVATISRPIV
jgi:hypothetical protein